MKIPMLPCMNEFLNDHKCIYASAHLLELYNVVNLNLSKAMCVFAMWIFTQYSHFSASRLRI